MVEFKFHKVVAEGNIEYYGNIVFDEFPRAVILNSRQTKTPTGSDPWVSGTVKAVKAAIKNGYCVLTGLDMDTWELALWACSEYGGRQIIIAPIQSSEDKNELIAQVTANFELDHARTGWLFFNSVKTRSKKSDWPVRDKLAVEYADKIIPVCIRDNGNLDSLIKGEISNSNKTVIDDFRTKYRTKKDDDEFRPEDIKVAIPRAGWNYITHWSRTCYGPWPGEKASSFYRRLAESSRYYPNTGLATLKNIVSEKLIHGSARFHKGSLTAVAFSSLHPADILPLMSWRKRYVRWNFEPYGVAISRQVAIDSGIQPVIYGAPGFYDRLTEPDKLYFQSEGESGNWRVEKEWRYIGDYNLSNISPENIRIIVCRPSEIETFKDITAIKVLSFS